MQQQLDNNSDDQQDLGTATYIHSFALMLRNHFHHTREKQTIEEAADMAETAILVASDGDPNLPSYHYSLALILGDQFCDSGIPETIEHAIRAARRSSELAPNGCSDRLCYLDTLSYMLYDHFDVSNDPDSLRDSRKVIEEAVQECPESDPYRPEYVDHFGRVLIDLVTFTGSVSVQELDPALEYVRQSVNSLPDGYSHKGQYLSTLAEMLHCRYTITLGEADPSEAVQVAKDAIAAVPECSLERAIYLHSLGRLLADRWDYTQVSSDIDEAIHLARQATTEFHDHDYDWVNRRIDLGRFLAGRYAAIGSLKDLDEAIEIAREIFRISLNDHKRRLGRSLDLANRLSQRHVRTGSLSDHEEAIKVVKTNLSLAQHDDPARGHAFHILSTAMGDRYFLSGSMDDLDKSIKLAQKAVENTPMTSTDWLRCLATLGSSFATRYRQTGRLADLDEAIRILERVLNKTPKRDRMWIEVVSCIGNLFTNRYERLGEASDLARSIELAQTALEKCQQGNESRGSYLHRLSTALIHRFKRERSMADLETSINLSYQAMEVTSTNDVNYSTILHGMGVSLGIKYKITNALPDLEKAIRFTKKAVDAMGEAHRYQTEALSTVGENLLRRAAATSCKDDEQEATAFFHRAIIKTQSSVKSRMEAARRVIFIYTSRSEWRLAYEAAVLAIDLLPQLVMRSLGNTDKQEILTIAAGLSSDAAGLALQLGEAPMVALNMLEKGRGMIASSLDDLHMDLDNIKATHPDLATRFISLRNQLGRDSITQGNASLAWNQDSDKRHEAGFEFDKLVAEIRRQPGFEDFLLPPTEPEVMAAAKYGPIIMINVCALRCDAIIAEPHQIRAIPLPDLDHHTMINFVVDGTLRSSRSMEWLWTCIASPVLEALDLTKAPGAEWPHVWWIMTGLLTKFPIHAAGVYKTDTSDNVLDRVVSSYQTSVQSIIRGRKRPTATRPLQQALLVSMEKTPGSFDLPNAPKEVATVRKVCESMSMTTVESKPRKQDIIAQLFQSDIFHYAGHAYTDGYNPIESYLCLDDDKTNCLTVSNLLDNNLQRQSPFLAYLSACGTGEMQNNNLTDEGIHLIAGFQLLGFRHVIGTLWAVRDSICVKIAKLVYEELRDSGTTDRTVAQALHNATRKLRDSWLDSRDSNQRTISVEISSSQENGITASMRDVLPWEEEESWPDWIVYVHYGV
ncbi:30S ribosomal S17P protein [Fusarium sp. NRRL 52700]|nr:30S ribosomal S17P protein [Fusarium sp. NRRL 52700]